MVLFVGIKIEIDSISIGKRVSVKSPITNYIYPLRRNIITFPIASVVVSPQLRAPEEEIVGPPAGMAVELIVDKGTDRRREGRLALEG